MSLLPAGFFYGHRTAFERPWEGTIKNIRAWIALGFAITLAACVSSRRVDVSAEEATARYFDADLAFFDQRFEKDSVAYALKAITRAGQDAPERLQTSLDQIDNPGLRRRLGRLVVDEYVVRYDYPAAVLAADTLGLDDALTPVERIYAGFPLPEATMEREVVEVPYESGRIPGRINGREVSIILDTGAPGVGLQYELVEELGLDVDRSASRVSRVPAYGLEFPVYAVLIDEMTIGGLTVTNVPGNVGEVPDEQKPAAERLRRQTGGAEVIMGLDALRNFVDVVEFDWNKGVVRLVKDDPNPKSRPNYILNEGRGPVIKVRAGMRVTNLAVDTGAYGHLVGPETIGAARKRGLRTYQQSWGAFSEPLIRLEIYGHGNIDVWASSNRFAEDPDVGVTGVLGKLYDGRLRIDTESRTLTIEDYDAREVSYAFEPETETFFDRSERP